MSLTGDVLTVQRVIRASPVAVFDLLADPARHVDIDGSGTVKASRGGGRRLALGDSFGMDMLLGVAYSTRNVVVEFDENRRIAWQTLAAAPLGREVGDPGADILQRQRPRQIVDRLRYFRIAEQFEQGFHMLGSGDHAVGAQALGIGGPHGLADFRLLFGACCQDGLGRGAHGGSTIMLRRAYPRSSPSLRQDGPMPQIVAMLKVHGRPPGRPRTEAACRRERRTHG